MCGRIFCLFPDKDALVNSVLTSMTSDISIKDQIENYFGPQYNIAPSSHIPVLESKVSEDDKDGILSLSLTQLLWGLRRGSTKSLHVNARSEEIYEKVTFRGLIDSERCVIVCSGYYEWKISPFDKNKKTPYSFRLKNEDVCFIAALRDPKTGSVVLMTRSATSKIEKIHSRMPLILNKNLLTRWFDHTVAFSTLFDELVSRENYLSPGMEIEFAPLGPTVNDAKNTTKECLQSMKEYNEKSFKRGIGKYFAPIKKSKIQ